MRDPGLVAAPSVDPATVRVPAFADQLTDEEVAAVLSYERSSWGNQAGPVKAEDVVARR
jgi:mono/diheme cytochrome c family protein